VPRTVTILVPNTRTEYWLTDAILAAGDKLKRNGEAWVVAAISEAERDRSLTIKLRRDDGSQPEQTG
jgi:hypothetical protein